MMLSLALAQQLKKAGLEWQPRLHDVFALPERGMDDRRFILTEVLAYIELFHGSPVVTFHGTAEWALDYILQTEAVWVPTETQLRQQVQGKARNLLLQETADGYEVRCNFRGQALSFAAADACEAYASALLQILLQQAADPGAN